MKIAVLGLGEVGSAFARDLLQQGIEVTGWDPEPKDLPKGLNFAASNADAAKGADIILSANLASVATDIAKEVAAVLKAQQVFAEMNTTSPQLKKEVATIIASSGAKAVDVAIMAPVPPKGLATPVYVSGDGATAFSDAMTPLGMPVTLIEGEAGNAARHKLVRSIAYKGIAAVVIECIEAARELDMEDYARAQLASLIADPAMIDRFIAGSKKHAVRRQHEMEAVKELLDEIEVLPLTTEASIKRLIELQKG